MRPVTLSVTLPSFGPIFGADDHRALLDLAKLAESAGVDRLLIADHVVMGPDLDDYPFGTFPFGPEVGWLEPLTCLSAIAGVTERVRLSTKILIAPLRPAALLAKTLATLDQLSSGRVEVGVATGWQRKEYEAVGVGWEHRGQALTDTIAACRALWGPSPTRFDSPTISFSDVWCEPKPVQSGGVPVWFAGGLHARNLDRLVRLGDGWIPPAYCPLETFTPLVDELRTALHEGGRESEAFGVQADLDVVVDDRGKPDLSASLAAVPQWIAAGATTINVVLTLFIGRLERAPGFFDELAAGWKREVG
ncbi:MAG: TIGR03619 family F420-dependent LLM class oxidoreductase [Acidimicrobiales bacterium]|nr:TIGR03619 family F420-dependent LLM class oxidoreductase [Acidimicrobiales bacterium]